MSMADASPEPLTIEQRTRLRAAAVAGAKFGFPMIRCMPLGKAPRDKRFFDRAATTPEAAHALFTDPHGEPDDSNPGVATGLMLPDGRILHVLDVDVKRNGLASLEQLELEYLDLDTFTVRTPSGGLHLYYGLPFDGIIRTGGIDRVAPGIDDRGHHNLVVAPGAITPQGAYTVVKKLPILTAPPQLIEALTRKRKEALKAEHLTLVDSLAAQDWGRDFLRDLPIPDHGSRNATVYNTAHILREHGISEVLANTLMLEEWNPIPESPEELAKAIGSAYSKEGRSGDGSKSAEAQFEDLSDEIDEAIPHPAIAEAREVQRRRNRLGLIGMEELLNRPLGGDAPLIKGLLDEGALSALIGHPGKGKSFLVLDLGLSVALGKPWCGRPTTQGAVVYISAEGGGIGKRVTAAALKHGLSGSTGFPPFYVVESGVDLYSADTDVNLLTEQIAAKVATLEIPLRLTIVDTLARSMGGGDENDAGAIGMVVSRLDRLRERFSTHVLAVHHLGKDASKGARGSSALFGALDTELKIGGDGDVRELIASKQRDHDQGVVAFFKLKAVSIGTDADGALVTSAVPEFFGKAEDAAAPDDLPSDAATVETTDEAEDIAALRIGEASIKAGSVDKPGWVNAQDIRKALVRDGVIKASETAAHPAQAARMQSLRILERLARLGRIEFDPTKQRVRVKTHTRT